MSGCERAPRSEIWGWFGDSGDHRAPPLGIGKGFGNAHRIVTGSPPLVSRRSSFGRRAALSTLSILVALLIAGQAVTIYFVYQQSGQISKLTRTSQNLQLEALQRKLPKSQYPPGHRRDGGGDGERHRVLLCHQSQETARAWWSPGVWGLP